MRGKHAGTQAHVVCNCVLVLLLDGQQAQDKTRLLLNLLATAGAQSVLARLRKCACRRGGLARGSIPARAAGTVTLQQQQQAGITVATQAAASARVNSPRQRPCALVGGALPVHVGIEGQQRHHRLDGIASDHLVHVFLCAPAVATQRRTPRTATSAFV